ncbi:opsin-like protein [Ilyonectria robusta]
MPDDEQIGNAADGIPAPFLGRVNMSKGREQPGQYHDYICHHCHEGMSSIDSGKKKQFEQKQRHGETPVDIACPEDLATYVVIRVGEVLVMIRVRSAVEARCVTRGHGKVSERGDDGGQCSDDMEDAARDGDVPGQQRKDGRRDDHQYKDDPKSSNSIMAGDLVHGWLG